ncbi:branched-chain amino acid ABC transporter permease [Nocardioides carbamazepini]|uniref:branched-chain amino acid ABC transporter permease n=1 Tax=Nocardioides carbamazepini TaxID=2854259 RepID=UPI00214A0402|nr:branched-chain amino acid ABC transporter permease [Nocardioides carbamazepini]MCR1783397.1 branched-chain amino acid ABC transporter permease [Nocardioides carbamazepini]
MQLLMQQLLNGIALGSIYALFAVGFSLILAKMGILNVAHGTFATWGALSSYWLVFEHGLSFWLALVLGVVFAGALGVAADLIAFEPLRKRNAGTFAPIIASIGIWIVLLTLAEAFSGPTATSYPTESVPTEPIRVAGLLLLPAQVISVIALVVIVTAVHLLLTRSRFGAAVRAVSVDPRSATIVGVNARSTLIAVAFLAAAIAGLAGILAALSDNNVSFGIGEALLLKGFAAVVVGGYGDIRGAALLGVAIGVLEVMSAQYISSGFRDAITFGVLLVVLVLRPQGIFGERQLVRA